MNEFAGWGVAGLALAWSIINTVYTWYAAQQSVTKKEIDALSEKTGQLGTRLTKIEAELSAMPSAEQFHEIDKKVSEVAGNIRTMEAEMRPVASSVRRIEDFLLNSNMGALTRK